MSIIVITKVKDSQRQRPLGDDHQMRMSEQVARYIMEMLDSRETIEGPVRIEAPGRDGTTGSAAR